MLLKMQRLYVFGNYTLEQMFSRRRSGPFNVTLMDVDTEAIARLEPDDRGQLQAAETDMDMRFADCVLDFKNLGLAASLFQGVISTMGSTLFEGIKPFIIAEVKDNMMADVNAQIRSITGKMPKTKVPIADLAVAEGRAYVRRMGYDPYRLADRQIKQGPLTLRITELTVSGLSSFQRLGDIGVQVRSSVLQLSLHVVTDRVTGSLRWQYQMELIKTYGRSGVTNFTVDHVQVRAVVNQTLDIRNKPVLDRLDMEVGKVTVTMDRQEPLDYVVELAVNQLPSLLRHIIVDALEEPVKGKVQELLDEVQVEKLVEERLPELDRMSDGGGGGGGQQ